LRVRENDPGWPMLFFFLKGLWKNSGEKKGDWRRKIRLPPSDLRRCVFNDVFVLFFSFYLFFSFLSSFHLNSNSANNNNNNNNRDASAKGVSKRLIRVKKSQGSRQNNFEKKKKKKQFRNLFIFADDDVDGEISNPLSYLVSFVLLFFFTSI
jgi:hypothetical protein